MDYTINKTLNKSFEEAITYVKEELAKEGFGIISEIDMKGKFKEKLDVPFRNYTILGACNPAMAHKAINTEDKIGVMLPCNVLVQEHEEGRVEVSAIDPLKSIGSIENDNLHAVANEVSEKLNLVMGRL